MALMIALCSWFQHQFPGVALNELRQRLAVAYGGTKGEFNKEYNPDSWSGDEGPSQLAQMVSRGTIQLNQDDDETNYYSGGY